MEQEENKKTINLQLTIKEADYIIKTLAEKPYKDVYQLMQKVQIQANEQLKEEKNG